MQFVKNVIKKTVFFEAIQEAQLARSVRQRTPNHQNMVNFYAQFIKPGDVCFDVGANIGNRVKVFLEIGASIIAIEPQNLCVRVLGKVFGDNANVKLIQKALGETEGSSEMMVSDACTISSLSQTWVDSVRKSGRFSEHTWKKRQTVQITTLDSLIHKFGMPSFIKIDVEGFEYEVLKGLSKPVKALSFEFTPEYLENTILCIQHLSRLGNIELNHSLGETMKLELSNWVSSQEMVNTLAKYKTIALFGDVYVRFEG